MKHDGTLGINKEEEGGEESPGNTQMKKRTGRRSHCLRKMKSM
jgi:hypothetical protein